MKASETMSKSCQVRMKVVPAMPTAAKAKADEDGRRASRG